MAQFARPASDIATGGWATTPLWSKINEGSPGDGTLITSANNTNGDNADFTLSSVGAPQVATGHILRARWRKSGSGGHTVNAVCQLWEGTPGTGTLRATLTANNIGDTLQTSTYTLSEGEAAAIGDYSNLQLRISRQGDTGGAGATRRALEVDFAELETPDTAPPRGRVSWSALETPSAIEPTRGRVSWSEAEVPSVPIQGRVSTTFRASSGVIHASAGDAGGTEPTRARVSVAAFEVPVTPSRGRISVASVDVPDDWPHGFQGWDPPEVPTGNDIHVSSGGSIQAAINSLGSTGGIITLDAGVTYNVNLTLSERATPHPILIKTVDSANLPAPGERAMRGHRQYMAVLKSANNTDPIFHANHKAKHLYFENVVFDSLSKDHTMVTLGGDRHALQKVADRAEGFVFDRCIFDGHPTTGQRRGLQAHAKDVIVRGCSFWDIHWNNGDSWALGGWNGTENMLIENCHVEAAGYNIIFGGASSARSLGVAGEGMQPRNVTIRDCVLTKDPAWRTLNPQPAVKNLFETKHIIGLLMERCLLEKNWAFSWPSAVAMIVKVLNDEQNEPTIIVRDCLFRDIVIRDTGIPFTVVGEQDAGPSFPTQRQENIHFKNILAYNINIPPFNGQGQAMQVVNTGHDTTFDHITWRTNGHSFLQMWFDNGPKTANGFRYTNCAVSASTFGLNMIDDPNVLPGETNVQKFQNMHPDAVVSGNAVRQGSSNPSLPGMNYISAANWDASFDEHHRVIQGSAVAQVETTDGKSPGADVDDLMEKMPWAFSMSGTDPVRARISVASLQTPSLPDPTIIATDDFNRADGGLGSDWTVTTGGFTINSGRVRGTTGGGNNYAFWNADVFPDDQWAEILWEPVTAANPANGVVVRLSESGNGYTLVMRPVDSPVANDIRVARLNNHSFTLLQTLSETPVPGRRYRLSIAGDTLQVYEDGVAIGSPITDSTHASGQPGLRSFGTDGWVDDFAAGFVGDVPAQGRISVASLETPDIVTRGVASFAELEVPDVVPSAPSAQDDFERADGGLGDDWTVTTGGFEILNGQVRGTSAGVNNYAFWNADTFSPDQFSEILWLPADQGASSGVTVRLAANGNGYTLVLRPPLDGGGGNDIRLARLTNHGFTLLHTYAEAPVSGSRYRLSVEGNEFRVYKDGVEFGSVQTDSTYATGQPGLRSFGVVGWLDDWHGGSLTAEELPTRGRVSFTELEAPVVQARALVSVTEVEIPLVVTRGRVSWAEAETELAVTRGRLSFTEVEYPVGSTRGLVSFSEVEVPIGQSQGRVSFTEFEVPELGIVSTRGTASFAELEVPFGRSRGRISIAGVDVPIGAAAAKVSFSQVEVPLAVTPGLISFVEMETPLGGTSGRVSVTELQTPVGHSRGRTSFTAFEVPQVVGPDPARGLVSWTEGEWPNPTPTRGHISIAEAEMPFGPASLRVSFTEAETPIATTAARLSWAELTTPVAPSRGRASHVEVIVPDEGEVETSRPQHIMGRMGWVEWS